MEDDELSQARDQFYAGYFLRSFEILSSISPSDEFIRNEREVLLERSRFSMNAMPPHEIAEKKDLPPAIQAVVLTAELAEAKKASHDGLSNPSIVNALKELATRSLDPTARLLAAGGLAGGDGIINAIELVNDGTLEMQAMKVQLLLLLDRADLAEKTLLDMTNQNDDACVTKLASAWVNFALGNYQEAYLIFGDIQAQLCEGEEPEGRASIALLNGKAVANLQRKQYQEALEDLQRAHLQAPSDPDTLANMICCYRNMRRQEDADKCYQLLLQHCPNHRLIARTTQLSVAFEAFQQSIRVGA